MGHTWTELAVEDEKPLTVRVLSTPKDLTINIHSTVLPRLEGAPAALNDGNLSISTASEGKRTLLRVRFVQAGGFKVPKLDRIYYPLRVKQLKPVTPIKPTSCDARFEEGDLIIVLPEAFELKNTTGGKVSTVAKKA